MANSLTPGDIDASLREKVYQQNYTKKAKIDEIVYKELSNFVTEDGDFSELLRITPEGTLEHFPDFRLVQINRTKVYPNTVKGWHLHFKQDEIWHVLPTSHILVGLWDVRESSPSKGVSQKIVMGGGKAQLLYIPRGVAHGYANVTTKHADILYFVSNTFNIDDPDERRLPWDSLGPHFWQPARD